MDTDTPEEKQDAPPATEVTPSPGAKTVPKTSDEVVKKEGSRRKKDLEVRVSELEDENGLLRTSLAELQSFIKPKPSEAQTPSELDNFIYQTD